MGYTGLIYYFFLTAQPQFARFQSTKSNLAFFLERVLLMFLSGVELRHCSKGAGLVSLKGETLCVWRFIAMLIRCSGRSRKFFEEKHFEDVHPWEEVVA